MAFDPLMGIYFWGFLVFYLICIAVTWWYYSRRNAPMPC